MINRIRLAGVWVSDQDAALDFYVNKLGFAVQSDVTMPDGFRWLEVVPPGAQTAMSLTKPHPGHDVSVGGFANIVFGTEDIQATYDKLNARGVQFSEAPTPQSWGGIQALFADPDGNQFVLVQDR